MWAVCLEETSGFAIGQLQLAMAKLVCNDIGSSQPHERKMCLESQDQSSQTNLSAWNSCNCCNCCSATTLAGSVTTAASKASYPQ